MHLGENGLREGHCLCICICVYSYMSMYIHIYIGLERRLVEEGRIARAAANEGGVQL